ncbi:hypothetical protein BGZ54_007529 [Gamsiella multidivaricata]|nr:hypothetical protein BGZ54_007529 [Gamsiella multidivaricata]
MQIGNNVYCDTALILHELERRYPGEDCSKGLSDMITTWADKQLFNNVKDQMPWGASVEEQKARPLHAVFGNKAFLADRAQLSGGRSINAEAIKQAQPYLLDQLLSNLDSLELVLQTPMHSLKQQQTPRAEGGWVLGTALPSIADFSIYAIVWWLMTTKRAPEYVTAEQYPCVFEWYKQMKDCIQRHRHPTQDCVKISAEEALEVAKQAGGSNGFVSSKEDVHPLEKRHVGDVVAVTPNDYGKVPVEGRIVEITHRRVSIRPEPLASHPEIDVVIHFPRSGYMIVPANKASL